MRGWGPPLQCLIKVGGGGLAMRGWGPPLQDQGSTALTLALRAPRSIAATQTRLRNIETRETPSAVK